MAEIGVIFFKHDCEMGTSLTTVINTGFLLLKTI